MRMSQYYEAKSDKNDKVVVFYKDHANVRYAPVGLSREHAMSIEEFDDKYKPSKEPAPVKTDTTPLKGHDSDKK